MENKEQHGQVITYRYDYAFYVDEQAEEDIIWRQHIETLNRKRVMKSVSKKLISLLNSKYDLEKFESSGTEVFYEKQKVDYNFWVTPNSSIVKDALTNKDVVISPNVFSVTNILNISFCDEDWRYVNNSDRLQSEISFLFTHILFQEGISFKHKIHNEFYLNKPIEKTA